MKSKSNIAKLKSDKYVPIVTAEHPELRDASVGAR